MPDNDVYQDNDDLTQIVNPQVYILVSPHGIEAVYTTRKRAEAGQKKLTTEFAAYRGVETEILVMGVNP